MEWYVVLVVSVGGADVLVVLLSLPGMCKIQMPLGKAKPRVPFKAVSIISHRFNGELSFSGLNVDPSAVQVAFLLYLVQARHLTHGFCFVFEGLRCMFPCVPLSLSS
jgi:hypothetical protein